MRCIKVNQCCCGCTLQTGTKIIGWLSLLGGFFQVLSTLWSLIATRSSAYTAVNNYSTAESNIYLIVGIVISVIWIAVSIPLLIAASKNSSPGLLLPWLIYNVLITFVGIGLCIFLFVILFQQVHHIGIQILSIAASFLALAFNVYFGVVISSYYQELKTKEKQENSTNVVPLKVVV
uniref:Uncharacterized protein n=1 Tax=Daphnia galeata TaxID=27404 RepID=A0A8J2WLQ8_9CRUS|nr:unnamed protein product [Daphnia galeata]